MTKKKIAVISLCLILILSVALLAGCGKDGGGDLSGFVYQPEYMSLPSDVGNIEQAFHKDGVLYFSANVPTTREPAEGEPKPGDDDYYEGMYDDYQYGLYKMNIDGTGLEKIPNYSAPTMPEGKEGWIGTDRIALDSDGNMWVLESASFYHWTGENNDQYVDDGRQAILRKLDASGNELLSIDLTPYGEGKEWFYIQDIVAASDGHIYVSDGENAVYVFANSGEHVFNIDLESYSNCLVATADGNAAALMWDGGNNVIKVIDSAKKGWGESYPIASNVYNAYSGSGEYDFYYSNDNDLFGYSIAGKKETALINWIDVDMESTPSFIIPMEDGRIICLSYVYDDTTGYGNNELIMMTKVARSEIKEKEIITMACLYMDYNIRSQVIKFNKASTDYRIRITDYSIYNRYGEDSTEADWNAGLTKLNTEIISGNIPDLIVVDSELPIKQYAAKGLLEDITPYITNDSSLGGMDAFISNVFEACKVGDILPFAPSAFSIQTAMGASKNVGETPGWTMDEMMAALAKMPEGCTAFTPGYDKNTLLDYLCMVNIDNYVDWATASCDFNNPEFIKMLEFCKTCPDAIDYESFTEAEWEEYYAANDEEKLIREGKVLLSLASIYDFSELAYMRNRFSEPTTYIGFPTPEGVGGVFAVNSGVAISTKCKNKDAAWEFVRTLLTEEYQTNSWWGIPTNKAAFDKKVEQALKPNDGSSGGGGVAVEYAVGASSSRVIDYSNQQVTQEDIDKVLALIDQIDSTVNMETAIINIIREESAAFFAGKKSAEDTAKVIQSRVGTYVSEQS